MSEAAGGELAHRLREPAGEPEGALILIHGRGADENDLVPLLDMLDPERRLLGIAPGGPITNIPPGGRHWYVVQRVGFPEPASFDTSYVALTGFLDDTLEARGIGWDRTVIGGFSQGTVMSYATGLGEMRPVPAGILALSGFVPTVEGWKPDLASRQGLPVLIAHGEADPVIPVEFGRQARDLLSGDLDVTYRETRAPHAIDPRVVPELVGWVSERLR